MNKQPDNTASDRKGLEFRRELEQKQAGPSLFPERTFFHIYLNGEKIGSLSKQECTEPKPLRSLRGKKTKHLYWYVEIHPTPVNYFKSRLSAQDTEDAMQEVQKIWQSLAAQYIDTFTKILMSAMMPMTASRQERIICPECKQEQTAVIEQLYPFDSMIHNCEKCQHIIMESEWIRA